MLARILNTCLFVDISLQCGQARYANLQPGLVHLDIKYISGAVLDYIDLGIFDTKTGTNSLRSL
jgi:hypothetical protein